MSVIKIPEHFSKEWALVFREKMRTNKKLERLPKRLRAPIKIKTALITGALFAALSMSASMAQELVMYTSNPLVSVEKVQAAVREKGLNVSTVTGASGTLLRRIEAEAAKPAGHLFFTSSANTMQVFEDYFESYSSPELAFVNEDMRYPKDIFQPASINVVSVMINEDYLGEMPLPFSWADLAKPEWKGKIVMSNPETGSTGYTVIWGLSQLLDEETYKALIGNMVVTESSSAVPKSVAAGEYTAGITYETNPYNYLAGGQVEIGILYPEEGTFLTVEYAGIIKNNSNQAATQQVIDTILSKELQSDIFKETFRRPARNDIRVSDLHPHFPELTSLRIFPLDEMEAAAKQNEVLTQWRALPKGS